MRDLSLMTTVRQIAAETARTAVNAVEARVTAIETAPAAPSSIATDSLWDAKGDSVVGSGSDAAGRLAVGAPGAVLCADPDATLGQSWGRRPFSHVIYGDSGVDAVWTNMPLAQALWLGSERHIRRVDLTSYRQCRLVIQKRAVAGAAASILSVYYATSFSTLVAGYGSIGTSSVQVAANGASTAVESAWVDLTASARADVYVAIVGQGGDGVLDPTFGFVEVQFR